MKAFILAMVLAICSCSAQAQTTNKPTLTGRVVSPQGKPVAATVVIVHAEEKAKDIGRGFSRYLRPPPLARTDGEGRFKIESLDPDSVFGVTIVAPNCRPKILYQVDPVAGEMNAQLEAANSSDARVKVLRGQITDARGKAVPDALIRIGGVTRNKIMHWPASDIDFYAVTDDDGMFVIRAPVPFSAAEGSVEARGFAMSLFEGWEPGEKIHRLALSEGAALKGRLRQGGSLVAGAEIRLDNFGSESGSHLWNYSAITDGEGVFLFTNLPPHRGLSIYGTMESLGSRGALPKLRRQVHEPGSTNDIGDLALQPAFTIQGRVLLSDGKALPAGSYLTLMRSLTGTQDSLSAAPALNGSFAFVGVPAEKAILLLRIPGYEISPADRRLKSGSATNLVVSGNITNLVIRLQPK